jgi:hypothetical protein
MCKFMPSNLAVPAIYIKQAQALRLRSAALVGLASGDVCLTYKVPIRPC